MVRRFRMIAGPNGSGKSTLVKRLREDYSVNFLRRVFNRHSQGGHDVPSEKVVERYARSLAQVKNAIPCLSRAYFFDNSGLQMIYLGQYSTEDGFEFSVTPDRLPRWFRSLGLQG